MSTVDTNPAREPQDEEEAAPLPGDDTGDRPGLEKAKPASVSEDHLKTVLESLIFVSNSPVKARKLARVAKAPVADVRRLLVDLQQEYDGRGIELVQLSSGWQFRSSAANAPFVRDIVAKRPVRLTRAQLETLSIAAYRQPLTRPELEEIRGVDSSSALKVLLDRGLLKILGRKDEPGRPLLYGTSPHFLEFFSLKSLDELPTLKEFSELSDESKALFARKTGEDIETIGDIEVEEREYDESEFEEPPEEEDLDEDEEHDEDEARGEGEGAADIEGRAEAQGAEDEDVDDEGDEDADDEAMGDDDELDDELDDDELDDDELDDDELDDDELDDDSDESDFDDGSEEDDGAGWDGQARGHGHGDGSISSVEEE